MSAEIRTPRSNMKQGTQTRERTARARAKPHAHVKTGHDGSIRALSQNVLGYYRNLGSLRYGTSTASCKDAYGKMPFFS